MKIKRMKTISKPPIEIIFHSSIRSGASVSSVSWLSGLLLCLFSVGDSGDDDDDADDDDTAADDDIVMSVCWDNVTDGAIVLSFCTPCNSVVKTAIQGRKTHVCQTEQSHETEKYELNKLTSLPMCGFIAQLVEHRTGIAEVTGLNPVEALIFFRLLLSNCLNWKIYCDDHSSHCETDCITFDRYHTFPIFSFKQKIKHTVRFIVTNLVNT